MSDIYCGAKEVPPKKNQKRGSMKQCVEKGTYSYWGIKKIDPRLIKDARSGSKKLPRRDTVLNNIAKYKGRIKNLKGKIEAAKDKKAKEQAEKDLKKAQEELKKYGDIFKEIEKKKKK
jgi:hypothetical protein